MALWRDPLDELIDDLERAVPAAAAPPPRWGAHWEAVRRVLSTISWDEWPTLEEVAPVQQHPSDKKR